MKKLKVILLTLGVVTSVLAVIGGIFLWATKGLFDDQLEEY